jgi:hypothetical protein
LHRPHWPSKIASSRTPDSIGLVTRSMDDRKLAQGAGKRSERQPGIAPNRLLGTNPSRMGRRSYPIVPPAIQIFLDSALTTVLYLACPFFYSHSKIKN